MRHTSFPLKPGKNDPMCKYGHSPRIWGVKAPHIFRITALESDQQFYIYIALFLTMQGLSEAPNVLHLKNLTVTHFCVQQL